VAGGTAFFRKPFRFKLHTRSFNQFFGFWMAAFKAFLIFMTGGKNRLKRIAAFQAFESVVGHFLLQNYKIVINPPRRENYKIILYELKLLSNGFVM
jgi:hypothetical protein